MKEDSKSAKNPTRYLVNPFLSVTVLPFREKFAHASEKENHGETHRRFDSGSEIVGAAAAADAAAAAGWGRSSLDEFVLEG